MSPDLRATRGLCLVSAGLAALGLAASPARAELLTFDNLPDVPHQGLMPDGYGGLDWSNVYYVDGLSNDYNPSGYSVGTVSGRNVIFNGHGSDASFSAPGAFTLSSLSVTAAWRNGVTVTITGSLDGKVKDTARYTIGSTSPSFITPDFTGIDQVTIATAGGVHNPAYPSADNRQVVIDNLSLSFYASEKGYTLGNPFTPARTVGATEVFSAVPVYSGVSVYFDPTAAASYAFTDTGGPAFSGFEVPFTDADGRYAVSLYDPVTGRYGTPQAVAAGQWIDFGDAGVSGFLVSGISGYDGPVTFGLRFAQDGDADFTETALGLSAVPLPSTLPLFSAALAGLGLAGVGRRRANLRPGRLVP